MQEYIQWCENHLQAVYDEINAQRPDIVRHADTSRRSQKYRHDENVIASTPAMYRQVVVPAPGVKEYVTGKDLLAFAYVLCETEVILDMQPGVFHGCLKLCILVRVKQTCRLMVNADQFACLCCKYMH